jgi:hypothetical protein
VGLLNTNYENTVPNSRVSNVNQMLVLMLFILVKGKIFSNSSWLIHPYWLLFSVQIATLIYLSQLITSKHVLCTMDMDLQFIYAAYKL